MDGDKKASRLSALREKRERLARLRQKKLQKAASPELSAEAPPSGAPSSDPALGYQPEQDGEAALDSAAVDDIVDELLASPSTVDAIPAEVRARVGADAVAARRQEILRRCTWDGGKQRAVALVPRLVDSYSKGVQVGGEDVGEIGQSSASQAADGGSEDVNDAGEAATRVEASGAGNAMYSKEDPDEYTVAAAVAAAVDSEEYRSFVARAGRAVWRELRGSYGLGSVAPAGAGAGAGSSEQGDALGTRLGVRSDFTVEEPGPLGAYGANGPGPGPGQGQVAGSGTGVGAGSGAVRQRFSLTLVDALAGHSGGVTRDNGSEQRVAAGEDEDEEQGRGHGGASAVATSDPALQLAHASVGDRAVTDIAWCPQYPQLLLAAYAPASGRAGGPRLAGPGSGLAAGATGYLRGDGAFVVDGVAVAGEQGQRRRRRRQRGGGGGLHAPGVQGAAHSGTRGAGPSFSSSSFSSSSAASLGALRATTAASGLVLAWDAARGDGPGGPEMVFSAEEAVVKAQWHPQHGRVAVGGCASGRLCVWDGRAGSRPVLQAAPGSKTLSSAVVGLSVSGSGSGCTAHAASVDGQLASWDLAAGLQLVGAGSGSGSGAGAGQQGAPTEWFSYASTQGTYKPPSKSKRRIGVSCMAGLPDDPGAVVLGGADGGLFSARFGARGASVLHRLPAHAAAVSDVCAHPDGGRFEGVFATAGLDWAVRLWAPRAAARPLVSVLGLGAAASAVDLHPQHAGVVATATVGGEAHLWSLVGPGDEVVGSTLALPAVRVRLAPSSRQLKGAAGGREQWGGQGSAATCARWSQTGGGLAIGDAAGRLHVLGVDAGQVAGCGVGRARGALLRSVREAAEGREEEADGARRAASGAGGVTSEDAGESKLSELDAAADASHWVDAPLVGAGEVDEATGLAGGRLWFEPSEGAGKGAAAEGGAVAPDAWGAQLREVSLMAGLAGQSGDSREM